MADYRVGMPDPRLADQWNLFCLEKLEFRTSVLRLFCIRLSLSRSDAASDQAAEDVEDDERNAAGSAEN